MRILGRALTRGLLALGLAGCLFSCSEESVSVKMRTEPPLAHHVDDTSVVLAEGTMMAIQLQLMEDDEPADEDPTFELVATNPKVADVRTTLERNVFAVLAVNPGTSSIQVRVKGRTVSELACTVNLQDPANIQNAR